MVEVPVVESESSSRVTSPYPTLTLRPDLHGQHLRSRPDSHRELPQSLIAAGLVYLRDSDIGGDSIRSQAVIGVIGKLRLLHRGQLCRPVHTGQHQ